MYEKNYSKKYSCHLCLVCKLEEETMHELVACNVNMPFENFWKEYGNESGDIELIAADVRESVNTRNRFTWISNICYNFKCYLDWHD